MSVVIEQTIETYGIDNWGAGYFGVNKKGNLIVRASENDTISADVKEIVEDLKKTRYKSADFASFSPTFDWTNPQTSNFFS